MHVGEPVSAAEYVIRQTTRANRRQTSVSFHRFISTIWHASDLLPVQSNNTVQTNVNRRIWSIRTVVPKSPRRAVCCFKNRFPCNFDRVVRNVHSFAINYSFSRWKHEKFLFLKKITVLTYVWQNAFGTRRVLSTVQSDYYEKMTNERAFFQWKV